MRKYLTKKEKACLELVVSGKKESLTEAVKEAYDCKTRDSAYVISSKLKDREPFKSELRKAQQMKEDIVKGEGKKLVEILEEIFPKRERMEILVRIAKGSDGRSVLMALQEINKLEGAYPDAKIGLYRDFEKERELILSPAEIPRLEAEKKAQKEREELLKEPEEAIIKEVKNS